MDMDGREEEMQEGRSQPPGAGEQVQETLQVPETQQVTETQQVQQAQTYQPPPPPETSGKKDQRAWLKPVAVGLLVVAVGVGSFFGGIAVGDDDHPKQVVVGGTGQGSQGGMDGQTMPTPGGTSGGEMPGRMGAMGEVTAISASSISIEDLRSGKTSTFRIDDSTEIIANRDTAKASDIEVGDNVMVVPSDSDETVAAQIMINPAMGGPGGGGGTPPGGTTSPKSSDSSSSSST
jgi:hypothetical protein